MQTVLFYFPGACSLAGQIVLEWLGQPYQLCRADNDTRATEAYARINPLRAVPALFVDGRVITENIAVLTHLAERRPGLLPLHGTPARDRANTWLSFVGTTLHPAFKPNLKPGLFSPYESMHATLQQTARQSVRRALAHVNAALADTGWLVGLGPNAADAYLYAVSRWAKKFVEMPREFVHVHRHQQNMEADPRVAFCLAIEQGTAKSSDSDAYQGEAQLTALVR